MALIQGYQRVIIENIRQKIDGGRLPAKAIISDAVTVEADIYADDHDTLLV